MKLDLGCGGNKREGFTGVDISPNCGADIVHDLKIYPWPFEDESVEEIHCAHFLEHLTSLERIPFMEECYRILKTGAKAQFVTPHWNSIRAIQDPTHQWPPVSEGFYAYFNKQWRAENKLEHYPIKPECDFDFTWWYRVSANIASRNTEYQQFAVMHYTNAADDLFVNVTKKGDKANADKK